MATTWEMIAVCIEDAVRAEDLVRELVGIDVTVLDDRGDGGDANEHERRHDEPLSRDDEGVRVARTQAEPGHEVDEGRGKAEPDRDEREMRARREAQTTALEELLHGALMLAGRRTLRRHRESAPGLAVVAAAGPSQHDAEPHVSRSDDDPPRQWDLAG